MITLAANFNERLEAFVEKYGLSHATVLLQRLTNENARNSTNSRNRLMSNFLILEALDTFEVEMNEYEANKLKLAKEARWAVIHLYKNFSQLSFNKIGKILEITPRAARYAHEKCNELIEVGKFEKAFNDRYIELEEKLVAFIARI